MKGKPPNRPRRTSQRVTPCLRRFTAAVVNDLLAHPGKRYFSWSKPDGAGADAVGPSPWPSPRRLAGCAVAALRWASPPSRRRVWTVAMSMVGRRGPTRAEEEAAATGPRVRATTRPPTPPPSHPTTSCAPYSVAAPTSARIGECGTCEADCPAAHVHTTCARSARPSTAGAVCASGACAGATRPAAPKSGARSAGSSRKNVCEVDCPPVAP
jgi:hypothetical protein